MTSPINEAIESINDSLREMESSIRIIPSTRTPNKFMLSHKLDSHLLNDYQTIVPSEQFYAYLEEELSKRGYAVDSFNYNRMMFDVLPESLGGEAAIKEAAKEHGLPEEVVD